MVTTGSEVGRDRHDFQAEKLRECVAALDEIIMALEACCTPDNPSSLDGLQSWAERRVAAVETAGRLERVAIDCIIQLSGTRETPLLRLCVSNPAAAGVVRARLTRIAELRAALCLVDERRRELLDRARRVVRSYAAALFPTPEAYGRSRPAPVQLPQLRGTHA